MERLANSEQTGATELKLDTYHATQHDRYNVSIFVNRADQSLQHDDFVNSAVDCLTSWRVVTAGGRMCSRFPVPVEA